MNKDSKARHSIGVASRRTGLKPDVIRAWERRYEAINPARTETNRRYYTDEQIERLLLLRRATLAGRQIGQIAHMSNKDLGELVAEDQQALSRVPGRSEIETSYDGETQFSACLAAIENLDAQELAYQLDRATLELPPFRLIEEVLVPLLQELGKLWEQGKLRIANEHMASNAIRAFLAQMQLNSKPADNSPHIIVATPMRQHHEIGALIAAATAASEGWRVTFLGADLPAEELASAAIQKNIKVIALSVVYPVDDPHLEKELLRLRRLVGEERVLIFGGGAIKGYSQTLDTISARQVRDLADFRITLRELR